MQSSSELISWLFSLEGRGEIYKLERMARALALLGNPHRRLSAVHIAGTKGKGSVAAMIDSCLRAAGYRSGLYTKPHLVRLTERTRINGAEMPAALMLDYVTRLKRIYDRAGLALTFFEFTVALMFLYFAEAEVDLAVIETGLGGRLDSTNMVRPLVSVITPIGFDHMDRLGYTLTAIAAEKGGIIKSGRPVVIGARQPEVQAVLSSIASRRKSQAWLIGREFSYRPYPYEHRLDCFGQSFEIEAAEVGLAGPFQLENAAIALAALEALEAQGWQIGELAMRAGLREVQWPGRFDTVMREPRLILDCAHNELGIQALVETLDIELGRGVKPKLLFACLENKRWDRMAELLGPRVSEVILTRIKPKRPMEPEHLVALFERYAPVRVIRDSSQAIADLLANSTRNDVILATGSVYLVGEVYEWLLSHQGRDGLFPEAIG